MKKKTFTIVYGVLVAFLLICIDMGIKYVTECVDEYESAQPEYAVEREITKLKDSALNGRISESVVIPNEAVCAYNICDSYEETLKPFIATLCNENDITYNVLSGGYSENGQVYGLYAGDELIAKLKLKCTSSKTLLSLLNINRWEVEGVYPDSISTIYSVAVEAPESYAVSINGKRVTDGEYVTYSQHGKNKVVIVDGLFDIPEVKVYDIYDEECAVSEKDGYYTAVTEGYHLLLPASYSVYDKGKCVEGTALGNSVEYNIVSSSDSIVLMDGYGQMLEYRNGDEVTLHDVKITIPSNYEITMNSVGLDAHISEISDNPYYEYLTEYVNMPKLVTYELSDSIRLPEVEIVDNLMNKVEYEYVNDTVEILTQAGLSDFPQALQREVHPIDIAEKWSLFMTNDYSKKEGKGFSEISGYLIPGSYLYIRAYEWSKSIDITFASGHKTPVFTESGMSNYVRYADNLFSVDIYLKKSMYVYDAKSDVEDILNDTWYFYKHDGKWALVDTVAIANK